MNLDQAFTFGQDCMNQDFSKQAKHPKISKKSPFYCIVKPTTQCRSQQTQRKTQIHNKENLDYQTGHHKRNPTDLNLIRYDTSPNSQGENSTNSRAGHNPSKCYRRLSFNTPNQTLRTQLPPVNNGDKYKKIAQQMKELIQKQKYFYDIGDYEHIEFIYEQLDQICQQI